MTKKFTKSVFILLLLFLNSEKSLAQIITLFNEDFSTSSFATNAWSFPNGQGNWIIGSSNTPAGAVAPNAFFNWAVSTSNYSTALLSNTINATSITGPVTLDYLLLFNPYSTATLEQFKVEYKDVASSTWTMLANYTNSITSMSTWTVSNMSLPGVSGQNFQIKFTAYGVSSFNITRWSLDNIVVKGTSCLSSLPSLTIAATSTVCAGKSATLTASGGGTSYTWSPAGGNASVAIVSPTVNTTYALISSMPGCTVGAVSAITTVTVLTNTVSITATASSSLVCAGSSVTLSASGASSYSWSNGATTSSVSVSPSVTSTYSVSNTNSLGCAAIKTLVVNVNPNPIVTAFSTSSMTCVGAANNLIASGASTYSWSNGGSSAIITVSPQVTTVYSVTGTDAQGCSSTTTINAVVGPPVTIATTNTAVCLGGTAVLTASGAVTYTWSNASTATTLSASPLSTTVYSVSGTNSIGCVSSGSITVSISPNPTVSVVSSTNAICVGATATLMASGAATYTWSNGLNGATTTVSPLVNTIYTVVGTSAAGCNGANNTSSISLTVKANPTVTAISSSSLLCSGLTLTLSASGANTYSWNFGAGGSTATVTAAGNGAYSVVGTNTQLCSSTATLNVGILPSPSITIASSATNICFGGTVSLLANGAQTYTWNTGSTVNVIYVAPISNTSYTVSGTGANACTDTKTVDIVVNAYPLLILTSSSSLICAGEPVSLTANGALTYSWSNAMSGSVITVSPALTTTYTVVGSNNGCNTTFTIVQNVDECTGIKKHVEQGPFYTAYPNPGKGVVTIQMNQFERPLTMEVYSATGQLVFFDQLTKINYELDLRDQPNGFYYLKMSDNLNQKVIKWIKQD